MFYKDDLNWMKGIGCYVWDTPEIVRAKKAYELQSDVSNNNRKVKLNRETNREKTTLFSFPAEVQRRSQERIQ